MATRHLFLGNSKAYIMLLAVIGLLSAALPSAYGATVIAFDAAANTSCSGCGPTVSWSHTVGSGSNTILIVGVSQGGPSITVSTVTYGGTPLTFIVHKNSVSDNVRAEMWYLLNPHPGTATIQVTFAGSPVFVLVVGSVSYFNVAGVGNSNSANGFADPASSTVNANTGDLVVDTLATGQEAPFPSPVGAGQTQRWQVGIDDDFAGGGSDKPASSPVIMTWSPITGTGNWAMVGADLQPIIIPEYPLGLPLLAIFMVISYGLIRRRTSTKKL